MSSLPISEIVAGGAFATAGALAWSAFAPSSQVFGPTIRRTGDDATLALTFDDGPNPLVTPKLLDLMYRYDAKASFFLIGGHVRKALAIAKEIKSRGHSIGNHTETHPPLVFLPPRRVQEELDHCDDAIASATGEKPEIMRPPSARWNYSQAKNERCGDVVRQGVGLEAAAGRASDSPLAPRARRRYCPFA